MMKFPYIYSWDKLFPMIPIKLSFGKGKIKTEALVDSGANISIFQKNIAEYLGIKIEEGKSISLQGVGAKIRGYIYQVILEVDRVKFSCKIVFSNKLTTSVNILGREDFFEHFEVTFNEKKKYLILK